MNKKLKSRKLIRVEIVQPGPGECYPVAWAFCEDGSLWWINMKDDSPSQELNKWQLEAAIPDMEEE